MTMLRVLAAALAAAFAFAAGSAQAEMKREWVEYGHGETKLKAYMHLNSCSSGANLKLALRPSAASVT